jgi:hypothetical protein
VSSLGDPAVLRYIGHLFVAGATGSAIWYAYRWLRARNRAAALVFALGLLARFAVGLFLVVSWYASAPTGRWTQADPRWFPDAIGYYTNASLAADHGLAFVDLASSTYPAVLAVWLKLVGNVPAAPLFLNVLLYAVAAVVVVWPFSKQESASDPIPGAVMMAGFAFSPILILLSVQPLKDALFVAAVMLSAIGLWLLLRRACAAPEQSDQPGGLTRGLLATAIGVFVLSGIRAYFGVMILGIVTGVLGIWLLHQKRRTLARFASLAVAIVACVWLATSTGGGVYYDALAEPVLAPVKSALVAMLTPAVASYAAPASTESMPQMVQRFRRGFEEGGGASSFAQPTTSIARREGWFPKLKALTVGLAAIFIPITLVRWTGALWFEGGRGLLFATDIDTLVLDATILCCLIVVWRRRNDLPNKAYALYAIVLAVAATGLIGYIVTNFGTLFRLRLMAAVPLWLLPMALAQRLPDATPVYKE